MRCVANKGSYILTLDADAVVRNAGKSPDDILKEIKTRKVKRSENHENMNAANYQSPHIFWSNDYHTSSPINSGAFLCVNNKNSEFVLKKVYDHLHGITFFGFRIGTIKLGSITILQGVKTNLILPALS
jgi:hypothetical protein